MAAFPPAATSFGLPAAAFAVVAFILSGCADPASAVASGPEAAFKSGGGGGGCLDVAPGVTIDQAVDQPDPATSLPIRFLVHFDVDVRGFDKNDVVVQGTAAAGASVTITPVNGSRKRYEVRLTKLQQAGTITVSVASAAATAAGKCPSLTAGSTSTDNAVTYMPLANSR